MNHGHTNENRQRTLPASVAVGQARQAQAFWAAQPMKRRLSCLRRLRHALAEGGDAFARAVAQCRHSSLGEVLVTEIIPLLDACRWLERNAERVLRPRSRAGAGLLWRTGISLKVYREPLGVILVAGPSNYPLFLPAVQALQAIVAGNAVLLKPAPGSRECLARFAGILSDSGLPKDILQVLGEDKEVIGEALHSGIDKVLLTGSSETGRVIARIAADHLVPATMELSGADPVLVCEDADLTLTARALAFGLLLNHGRTCIAPRRVFVHHSRAAALEERLHAELATRKPCPQPPGKTDHELQSLIADAVGRGARLVCGKADPGALEFPVVLAETPPGTPLLNANIFAPVLHLISVRDDYEALELANSCCYALGASIFSSNVARARMLASRIRAGTVTINDLIAPTAHPGLPFGGRGQSGYGVTRGPEGLLELTAAKAVAVPRLSWRTHYYPLKTSDETIFLAWLQTNHSQSLSARLCAIGKLARAVLLRRNPLPSYTH